MSGEIVRSKRTGVLMHPACVQTGRFLILPHPRTSVPTYFLHSTSDADLDEMYELSTLKDGKFDRSWMLSSVNEVVSSGQLEILAKVDVRFLIVALVHGVLDDGKFRSVEDTFEQIALALQASRREQLELAIPQVKEKLCELQTHESTHQQEWADVASFGTLPLVHKAIQEVADVQDLPNGEQAYRLSTSKVFAMLDSKHERLALKSTFVASPNMLARSFERRWPLDSDPSPYVVSQQDAEEEADCHEAQQLRKRIAAEIIATNLPPQLAAEYFPHLGLSLA